MKNNKYNIFVIVVCMIGIIAVVSNIISNKSSEVSLDSDYIRYKSTTENEIDITDEINELSDSLLRNSQNCTHVGGYLDRISLLTNEKVLLDRPIEYIEKVVNVKSFVELEEYIEDDLRECIMDKIKRLWEEKEGYLREVIGKDKNAIVKVVKSTTESDKPNYDIEVEIVGYKVDETYDEEIDKMVMGRGYAPNTITKIGKAKNIRYNDYIACAESNPQYNNKLSDALDVNICVIGNEIDTISILKDIYTGQFPVSDGCDSLDLNMADELNTLEDYQREMVLRVGAMLGIDNLDKEIEEVIKEVSLMKSYKDRGKVKIIEKEGYDIALTYAIRINTIDMGDIDEDTFPVFMSRIDIIKK